MAGKIELERVFLGMKDQIWRKDHGVKPLDSTLVGWTDNFLIGCMFLMDGGPEDIEQKARAFNKHLIKKKVEVAGLSGEGLMPGHKAAVQALTHDVCRSVIIQKAKEMEGIKRDIVAPLIQKEWAKETAVNYARLLQVINVAEPLMTG